MWSCWNSLHVAHSVERLHVVRMVESHICTNCLRVNLERVHPHMNIGYYFRCRGTFVWIGCQMWCGSIQNNQKSEGFVSNLFRPVIEEVEVSKFFCSKAAHARSFRSRFYGIAEWAGLHHVLIEVIKITRKIQVSRPLLELYGIHVVMLQMKVPQVPIVRQLAYNVAWSFTFCFSAHTCGVFCSLAQVLGCLIFQCSSWVLLYWGFLSIFALVQLAAVLEEPKERDLRHQYLSHSFFFSRFFP